MAPTCSSLRKKEEICRDEHKLARRFFGDLPERYWASRYICPEAPTIQVIILPRLKKEHRGKALGPSRLRSSFSYSDAPETKATSSEELLIGLPRIYAPDSKFPTGQSTSRGSLAAVLFPSDATHTALGQNYAEDRWTDQMAVTDSQYSYNFADLPEIPDEDDLDANVHGATPSTYNPVHCKQDNFYRCPEALFSGVMGLSALPCE